MKKIAIILLNYKSAKETVDCVASLLQIQTKGFEYQITIVDNSPTDSGGKLKSLAKAATEKVQLIDSEENTGFSEGNNIGIRHALANNFDYFLILNNDTIVEKSFLIHLLSAMEKNDAGIAVPKIYFAKGHEFHKDRYKAQDKGKVIWYAGGKIDWNNVVGHHRGVDEVDHGQYDKTEPTEYATGACMLIKREVIENVGMFDKNYFLYYEDSDLSMRAVKYGYKIYFQPGSVVWHKNAASSGGSGSKLQDYYTTRNRLLFGSKYAPPRSKIALIKQSLSLLKSGRKYQKKGVKDFYLRKFGKAAFQK